MERINTWQDAYNTGTAIVDLGDGIRVPLPLDGVFPGEPGPPGAGVPEGGAPLQVIRRTLTGSTTEWVTPTKGMVGLSRVDNTPDAEKPLSEAQAEVLGGKADLIGGKVPVEQVDLKPVTPTNGARPVGKGELTIDARDYGAVGGSWDPVTANTVDQGGALQAAVDACSAQGGGAVYVPPGHYRVGAAGVTVPSNVTLRGRYASIFITGNYAGFKLATGASRVRFRGLRLVGTLPETDISVIQNQVGIQAYSTWDNPIRSFKVTDCEFERIQGTALQMRHVQGFRIIGNDITKHGYAAIGGHSVSRGLIEDNDIIGTGNLPSYVGNSYGVYLSTLESAGVVGSTENPRSSDVTVSKNRVTNQSWSCLDTHVGERIKFINNEIKDCKASAINCVFIDPNSLLAPRDITIEGNTVTYSKLLEPDQSMTMAILMRGSIAPDPARQRVTGTIRGNIIRRYGRQDTSTSGAIFVGSAQGVIVDGNSMTECRAIGIHVRDSRGTVINGNTFTDLWRSSGIATAVYLGFDYDTEMDLTVTNNRFVRGSLSELEGLPAGAVVNNSAINGTNSAGISVIEGNNEWGTATFATAHTRYQVGTGRLRRMSASAAPTTGTWLTGEQVVNSAPAPGGYMGWVCTTNGTPGVWKGYGLIAA